MDNQTNQKSESLVTKIFTFSNMLTPKIITFVYWVLLAFVVVGGIFAMINNFLIGLVSTLAGLVAVRVWCELLIVLFTINDNIKKIANK